MPGNSPDTPLTCRRSHLYLYTVNSTTPTPKSAPSATDQQNFVSPFESLPYQVNFENDPTATAPAQRVDITDQLDPNLDWSTFQWTGFGFGDNTIAIPANTQHYETTLPMTYNGVTFRVVVTLDLNPLTGMVHASFQSLNAANLMTGLATCPGTLPWGRPTRTPTSRPACSSASCRPRMAPAAGWAISPTPCIPRPAWPPAPRSATSRTSPSTSATRSPPTRSARLTPPKASTRTSRPSSRSTPSPLPAPSPPCRPTSRRTRLTVSWSGTDDPGGSGIGSYTIYVSMDGGPFTPWLTATTQTSATFTGVDGHTYGFFSVATDNAGNLQAVPAAAQATTTVDASPPRPAPSPPCRPSAPAASRSSWSGSNPNGLAIASYDVYVSDDDGPFTPLLTDTTLTSTTFTGSDDHTYAFYSVATDVVGKSQPTPTSAQATTKVDTVAPTSSVVALPAVSASVNFTGDLVRHRRCRRLGPGHVLDLRLGQRRAVRPVDLEHHGHSASYVGLDGHTYGFFSIATDNVGNREALKTIADATTTVDAMPPISTVAALPAFSPATFTLSWSGSASTASVSPLMTSTFRTTAGPPRPS